MTSRLREWGVPQWGSSSPDYETKEIKNIYVDSIGGNLKGDIRARSRMQQHVLDKQRTSLPERIVLDRWIVSGEEYV
ncbi:hypothetical protein F2Q69_00063575 [Brassica cretica]|uniref:Uncharacterized protein n=1 Tax=Brassica cretica TaxID=69181 RepID=A0A8S9RC82_BRACR|nr:hypothetical protein F2Q69_00063575 [Brassica cretica]